MSNSFRPTMFSRRVIVAAKYAFVTATIVKSGESTRNKHGACSKSSRKSSMRGSKCFPPTDSAFSRRSQIKSEVSYVLRHHKTCPRLQSRLYVVVRENRPQHAGLLKRAFAALDCESKISRVMR